MHGRFCNFSILIYLCSVCLLLYCVFQFPLSLVIYIYLIICAVMSCFGQLMDKVPRGLGQEV